MRHGTISLRVTNFHMYLLVFDIIKGRLSATVGLLDHHRKTDEWRWKNIAFLSSIKILAFNTNHFRKQIHI